MKSLAKLGVVIAALPLLGCGPMFSSVQIVNANIAVSAAETAGAKKYAIYEYTAAREYLQKAREEGAYSDFWAAQKYADAALEYAVRARKKSETMSSSEQPPVIPSDLPPDATLTP